MRLRGLIKEVVGLMVGRIQCVHEWSVAPPAVPSPSPPSSSFFIAPFAAVFVRFNAPAAARLLRSFGREIGGGPSFFASAIFSQRTFWAAVYDEPSTRGGCPHMKAPTGLPSIYSLQITPFIPPNICPTSLFPSTNHFHSFIHNHNQKKHPTPLFRQSRTLNE